MIIAFTAGSFLPIQAGLNAQLGKAVNNPVSATLISFIVGTIALVTYILVTRQSISWEGLRTAHPVLWLGGLLGAFYLTVIILAFPRLGPALTFGLVVAGQMAISVLLDHTNTLVAQPHAFNFYRLIGIILIVAGVIMIRKF